MTNENEDLSATFWSALERVRTGLLAVTGEGDSHALPMTAHFDEDGPLFFFAPAEGRLMELLDGDARDATFYYVGPGHDLYATVHGTLIESDDQEARERFWSAEVERWFPGRKDSDEVVLLAFDPEEAEVWLPNKGIDASSIEVSRTPVDVHEEIDL